MYVYYIFVSRVGYTHELISREDLLNNRHYENECCWMIPGTVDPNDD